MNQGRSQNFSEVRVIFQIALDSLFELAPVFTFSRQRHRRKFTVVFVLVVKKSALDVQNLLFFSFTYWAHCRRRHCRPRRCSQDLSMCVNGWESEHGFSKNACHHFNSHNFWSKLYFYMKFLKYVSYSIEYLWPEVQLSASSLCFFFITFCSRCGIKWDKPRSM